MKKNEIGNIIRFHRKKSGLTQKALADIAGVGKTVVFDIENGKKSIRFDNILKIAGVLNININYTSPLMKEYFSEALNEKS
jgi:y4mF family transcriptional regulator